nr:erythromycin esterase family protein [Streptomyces sp. SBE_14.2]
MATDTTLKEAAHPLEATTLLKLLPTRPRLLALGEPTHGEDTLLTLRNDLFRELAEREGYRTIAIESDCIKALTVDAYVTTGKGTLDEVMRTGFSHGWGASAANRDLIRWMRAHNQDRPPSAHVRFAGCDGPLEMEAASSPRQSLTALYDYLASHADADRLPCTADTLDSLLGADDRWSDPAVMMDPVRSVGRTPEARELRVLADDLTSLLDTRTPHLIAAASREAWERARLYARSASGLLRYHHWMADTSPARFAQLTAIRDHMMADNLLALTARGPVFAHAHNAHLQRRKSSMHMAGKVLEWWSAGALVHAHLGDAFAYAATAVGTIPHRGVDTPPPATLEGRLYELPEDRTLLAPLAALSTTLIRRESPWFGYAPLDPAHLEDTDALVYVKDVRQC